MWCSGTQVMVMMVMMGIGRHVTVSSPRLMVPRTGAVGGSPHKVVVGVCCVSSRGAVLRMMMVVLGQSSHHGTVGGDIDRVLMVSSVAHSCGDPQIGPAVTATVGRGGVGEADGARRPVRLEHVVTLLTPSSARRTILASPFKPK